MGIMKKGAFYVGLIVGLVTIGGVGAILLAYLFTGKLPVVKMVGQDKPRLELVTPDELTALMRKQVRQAEAAVETPAGTGE
jgi:hypothetical protein